MRTWREVRNFAWHRPLADWTDCFQLGVAPKQAPLRLLTYAKLHFLSKLLVQCSRGAHNII